MNLLAELTGRGFEVTLNEQNGIVIYPASKLTEKHRDFIRQNKNEIVCELIKQQPYLQWHIVSETDDSYFSVIPPICLKRIKKKFPKAIIIEPVETLQ